MIPCWGLLSGLARLGLRTLLHRRRGRGECLLPALAVGSAEAVADLFRRTRREPRFGWEVTAACTSAGSGRIDGVPVVGDLDTVGLIARQGGYRVVAVGPARGWGPGRLQRLAWQLEDSAAELAVDPDLLEIAGPRLHISPVDGLPMLRLSQPRFTGAAWLLKRACDVVAAIALLLLTAPVLLGIALAVRRDGGPALYR